MSGPYNYGFRPPHGQSPMSPETPTSAYKIDVKRTKTKKWVEAKTQNYDGDDWGNDFDDEPDEPVPVPPLKPTMGFRQPSPSQATTANLPSNQPLTPQSAGPASMMRPQQPATNESALSSSPRATAGLPPLQTQTPPRPAPPIVHPESSDIRPQIVSGPSSMDSVSDKGPYEHLVSPQSANIGSGPGSNAGRHEAPPLNVTSPVGGRRTSPAPPQQQQQSQQPAQPQAARFPPRKSSMGQHDADRQANSRSGSTQPPWMEQRSRSPSTVRSPGTPSNAKAQPFVRPSDIYRRAENEREKERVSTESGRPSLDGVGGPRTERSISPANAPAGVGAGEHVRGNDLGLSKLQGEDAPQGNQRPVLEPVAERKSEYGFDRLLSQPQSQDQALPQPQPQPTTNITTTKSGSPQLAVPAHAPEPQYQRPTNEEVAEQRRYSSSPRLPDLARMSLFGDDFFSNPGKFADDAPPMPSLNSQQSGAALPAENLSTIDRTATPAALSTSSITPQRAESPMASGQPDKMEPVSPAQPPPTKENDEPVGLGLNSLPSRPSLPGGWVTETRSVTDEQTPPAVAEKKTAGMDPGEVSPITDNEDDELRGSGLATVKDRVSIPVSIPEASARVPQSHDRDTDKAEAAVKPLAPLNPRPSDHSPSDFVPPEKLQRESTMSTVTSPSPVKESDKLREEIMRSLSPVRPTSDFNDFNKNQASGLTVEDNGPRESTYLHGVYDDYWTAGDDKPDVPELPKKAEMDVKSSEKERDISGVPPLSPRKETAGTSPNLGRRFSWEGGSEQVTPGPADPQNNLLSEPQLQTASAAVVSPSLPSQDAQQPRAASSEQPRGAEQAQPPTTTTDETHIAVPPNSGTMSHQVSQVSSVPRDRLGSEAIEPPSPVSVVTDKNNASAAPTRRLSLAEEKSMVRVSSNPVSPSPPPGDHPALAQSAEATPPPASPEPSQQQPVAPVKITNFRDIMELQSASERINKYNETRAQFASMDSGLDNWLVNLKSQHPEHANATASFATNISNAGQGQSSPTTSQPNSQQPYYQQYLNASSTNVSTAAASGRPPAGSVSMGSHSPSSDFKHSSGQVGAKGKGLLLAAGKAGKGLLSKGKNKLRGTGDKNDSSPPPAQAQSRTKAERRTSWGISLGTRSSPRADSHARSASLSGSLSGPAPSSQTIPEHPASPTPPPQLPQTSRISPFDTLTQDRQASAWAPPRPQTPKHPAGALRDSDSEPVSPVSDTQSASAPKGHDKADDDGFDSGLGGGGDLQVPRPISKTQPSWDPFTGTPLVEEEGFEMGQSRDPSPHAHHAARASSVAQAQTTTSLAKNSTEDDDWVVVSPQSPPSGQVYVVSPESPPLARSFQPIEVSREISANEDDEESANRGAVSLAQQAQGQIQHHQPGQQDQPTTQHGQRIQHLPQQGTGYQAPQQYQYQHQTREQLPSQQQQVSPQRQSSFVGLPPIRRTSTFGMNLTKRAKKRFPLDEDEDDGHGLVSSPVGTTSAHFGQNTGSSTQGQQAGDGAFVESSQPVRVETGLSASRKDSAMSHQVISATSTQAATLATESTGVDWRVDDEKRPLDPQQSFRPGGPVPRPIDTNFATSHDGRSGGQPLAPGMRSQQGVVPPTVGGNPIQHLPPQGPWKLEESHLSEPLLPASRSRLSGSSTSPHQPFFGFDKETGVPSPMAPRQETQLPPRQKFSEVPPSSAQRYPELFTSPPQGYPNPGSPTGPRSSFDAGHHLYNRDNTSLQRTRTVDSEVSSVEPSGDDERGRGKRGSGFFKEVGGRFSRTSSRERQNFKDEVEPTGHPAESLERERMSVSSIGTVEMQDRQRRRSSFFLNLRGPKPSDAAQAQEGEGIPPSPKASPNPAVSPQIPHPGGPAERKRSWLGPGGNDSAAAPPSLSRSSTSTAGNEPAGGPKDPPKKRFSGLKVFNRTSSQQDLQPPPKPSTSHSVASSFHSHHSGNQLGVSDSQVTLGRERSNTTGSGPYGLMQTNKHLQTVGEEDRGRRSSASGFLSGLFGTRSSKTREAQQPADIASQQNQDPPQFRLQQQSGNQLLPSSLGPNRQMGPLPMRGPPQQFESQPQQTSLAQSSQQATNAGPQAQALEQRRADVSFLPVSQYSQPRSPPLDSQQSRHLAMTGARPVSEIESEDQNVPGRDVPGAVSPQLGPDQHVSRLSPPMQSGDFPRSRVNQSPRSQAMSPIGNQSQPSPSIPQVREESTHQLQRQDQPGAQENPVNATDPRHHLSEKLEGGQVQDADYRKPSFSQPHALGIQGLDGSSRISGQATSLQAPSVVREWSMNESDISQRSSFSASPQPPNIPQLQPPVVAAAANREIPVENPPYGPTSSFGPEGVQQDNQVYRQTPSLPPQPTEHQGYAPGHGNPGQFSQAPSQPTQRSSLPQFPGQGLGQQYPSQAPNDQGPKNAVSKWLRNRSSTQAAQPQSHQGQTKESTAKLIFSAFKRSSKQPEPRPQPTPQAEQGPHPQSFQIRQGQQITPPPGPLSQRTPLPIQGPHLDHQQRQRKSPSPAASFGQRLPPQQSLSSASSDISQGTGQVLQFHRPPGEPVMTRAIPTGPSSMGSMPSPQPYQEPQYDQVPIPRGYAAVHGEGGVAPSPYDIGRPSPPAQYPHHQMPSAQQAWAPPYGPRRHLSDTPTYNQPQGPSPQAQPHSQLQVQSRSQPMASPQADRRTSTTSYQSNVSHTSHGTQPGFGGFGGGVQGHNQQYQQQESRGVHPSDQDSGSHNIRSQLDHGSNSQAAIQVHSQTQVQQETQSQRNPQPSHFVHQVVLSNEPQEQHPSEHHLFQANAPGKHVGPSQDQPSHSGSLQESNAADSHGEHAHRSDESQATPAGPEAAYPKIQAAPQGLFIDTGSVLASNSRSVSPGVQVVVDRNVAPDSPAPPASHLSVNVQKANQDSSDDIYDSTPRLPSGPPPPPAQPIMATRTGQSQVSESSADEAPRNATHANGNANGNASATLTRGKSTRAELEDTEDERMRTIRLEAQEEKILVDPYEEKQSSGNKYRKEDDPDAPQMSATSYPGQEWNPYGAGGYEDWD